MKNILSDMIQLAQAEHSQMSHEKKGNPEFKDYKSTTS